MYIPTFNRVEDRERILRFIGEYGFATIVSSSTDGLTASHLPVLWENGPNEWGMLRSHMARANPQWRQFEPGRELLCIFHGPHAYISPSWYVNQHTVPTWNYGAVHVYGRPTLLEESALRDVVFDTTDKYESGMAQPWRLPLTEEELSKMLKAIVGFSIEITRVEAKFKLGQNRSAEDQAGMLRALEHSPDSGSRELARFILNQQADGETTAVPPDPIPS